MKLIDDDGETINDERVPKAMIKKLRGDLCGMNGNATHGI